MEDEEFPRGLLTENIARKLLLLSIEHEFVHMNVVAFPLT